MTRVKLTVSLPEEVVDYLRTTPNMSSTIAEAVAEYREHQLERTLEQSYRAGADEAEELNREWEVVDVDVEDDADEASAPTRPRK